MAITKKRPELPLAPADLAGMDQTHSNTIAWVNRPGNAWVSKELLLINGQVVGQPMVSQPDSRYGYECHCMVSADAMIAPKNQVTLSVRTADCLPIIIDSSAYCSVIHAGRVGTLLEITRNTCLILNAWGVDTCDIWFGPCASVMSYEIDQETSTHFDLVAENKAQIQSVFSGANFVNPRGHALCTIYDASILYSYRCGDKNRNVFFYGAGINVQA